MATKMEPGKGMLRAARRAEPEWQRIKDVLSKYENPRKNFFPDSETTDMVEMAVRLAVTKSKAADKAVGHRFKKALEEAKKHYKIIQRSAEALAALKVPKQVSVNSSEAWQVLAHDCEQAHDKLTKRMKLLTQSSLGRKPSPIAIAYEVIQALVNGRINKGKVAELCVDLFHPNLVGDEYKDKVANVAQTLYNANRKSLIKEVSN